MATTAFEHSAGAATLGVAPIVAGGGTGSVQTGLGNFGANDGNLASVTIVQGTYKGRAGSSFEFVDFGFSIPTDCRIIGFIVKVRAYRASSSSVSTSIQARPIPVASISPASFGVIGVISGSAGASEVEYTSPTFDLTLWNPSVSTVNSAAFGIDLHTRGGDDGETIYFDEVSLAVKYAPLLSANHIDHTQAIDTATQTQHNVAAANGIIQAESIGTPGLIQAHDAAVNDILQTESIGTPAISQAHLAAVNDLVHAQSIATVSATVAGAITAARLEQAQSTGTPAASVFYVITPADIAQTQNIEAVDITEMGTIAPADLAQLQTLNVALGEIPATDALSGAVVAYIQMAGSVVSMPALTGLIKIK